IATLSQRFEGNLSVADALGVAPALACLSRITQGDGTAEDFDQADWTLEARLEKTLAETGLSDMPLARPIETLSGGERTRIGLARLLLAEPDLILLDEPTNNLDRQGRAAVMDLVRRWPRGLVVASHDRDLLEVMDRIVELSPVGCTMFGGGWSAFAEARDAARSRAAAEAETAANRLKSTERKIQQAKERKDRSDAQGRSVRARGDQPKLVLDARAERAEHSGARGQHLANRQLGAAEMALTSAEAQLEILTPLSIDLPACDLPASRQLLSLRDVSMRFGDRHLFGPLCLEMRGPERVAIAGANGSGKSTLLKLITGEHSPASGAVDRHTGRIALLDQHVDQLDPDRPLLDNMAALAPHLNDHGVRAQLARFAFRGEDARQLTGTLSGGERLRAGLAAAFAAPEPPELLLLDEPTNHLDMEAVELLEASLNAYDGAILAISHDERFLETIGVTRRIVL
ncbi:MAG: ATP-binding cassette domain-containing protein, partial [Pseudomonadota bacterium]|nr:ATP-binding cassette domain-containing protein [Pseudomonadota bacterium]